MCEDHSNPLGFSWRHYGQDQTNDRLKRLRELGWKVVCTSNDSCDAVHDVYEHVMREATGKGYDEFSNGTRSFRLILLLGHLLNISKGLMGFVQLQYKTCCTGDYEKTWCTSTDRSALRLRDDKILTRIIADSVRLGVPIDSKDEHGIPMTYHSVEGLAAVAPTLPRHLLTDIVDRVVRGRYASLREVNDAIRMLEDIIKDQ